MTEAHAISMPPDGWTVDDLDSWPESHVRYELTDGALTVSPPPSSLHQAVAIRLGALLDALAPPPLAVTQAVDIRFARQLTRVPDLLVVRSSEPCRHWFTPSEVVLAVEIESKGSHTEDRVTKPALYARHGIQHYWRIELEPVVARLYRHDGSDRYQEIPSGGTDRMTATEPFAVDLPVADLLPRWAR